MTKKVFKNKWIEMFGNEYTCITQEKFWEHIRTIQGTDHDSMANAKFVIIMIATSNWSAGWLIRPWVDVCPWDQAWRWYKSDRAIRSKVKKALKRI